MHAVAHDDHPGDAGYTSVLHLLVWVAVLTVRVTMAVRVSMLCLASVLLCGWLVVLLWICGCQRRLVGGRVRRLELCELCVVVTVVAGDGGAVGVWRREKTLQQQPHKQSAVKICKDLNASYLHWGASGAATLHLSDDLTCDLTISCLSCPPRSPSSCPVSRDIILRSSHRNSFHVWM